MGGIKISKEHGINPSLTVCILCGEAIGVALMGRLPNDKEAPRQIVNGIEPCDKCKAKYLSVGVMLLEVGPDEKTPTGKLSVLKDDAFKRIFDQDIPKNKICMVEFGLLDSIGAMRTEVDNGKK